MTESAKSVKKKHQSDYLPDLEPSCAVCGSEDVYGISRVVGYFSVIENWNGSKKAELKRRQKGEYWSNNIT
ncbi:MAG TPA: anaerobic ribonucleoside-triphosphate reductase [Candidatus Bathyarchaeia archaeon]|nr:anaerobic ribonucleoside-triphosphate reductase [Candidatus Bathyarchaeia archaeon]